MTRIPLGYLPHRMETVWRKKPPTKVVLSLVTYTLEPSIVLKYFHKDQMGLKGFPRQFAVQLVSKQMGCVFCETDV